MRHSWIGPPVVPVPTSRHLTVAQAAAALGLPGPTPGARAQRLRRLEARGVLPPARRTALRRHRYYTIEEVEQCRERLRLSAD